MKKLNFINHLKLFVRSPKVLYVILIIFLLKQTFLVFLIPPWEAPDETAHVAYIMYLYNQKSFPSIKKTFTPVSIEKSFQNNHNILKQYTTQKITSGEQQDLFDRLNNQYSSETPNAASHPPLYYISLIPLYILALYLPSYWAIIFLRLGSVFWGVGSLILIYRLIRKVHFNNNIFPLFVVLLVSLQPMFSFITSIVNNDILVVFFYLLIITRSVELITVSKFTLKSALVDGLLLGVATLVKPQLFIGFVLYVSALIIKRVSLNYVVTALFVALSISASWYIRQFALEGSSMVNYAIQNIQPAPTSVFRYPIEFFQSKQHSGIFMSFWGFFGWLDVPMRQPIYLLFVLFISFGLSGLWQKRKYTIQAFLYVKHYWLLAIAFVSYGLGIIAFDIQSFALSHRFLIQGRYFAPILPIFISLFAYGIFLFDKKYRQIFQTLSIMIFILVQILMIATISHAYYGTYIPQLPLLKVYTL